MPLTHFREWKTLSGEREFTAILVSHHTDWGSRKQELAETMAENVTAPRRSLKLALALVAVLELGLFVSAAQAERVTNMVSRGGDIMPTTMPYAIWYLPAGNPFEPTSGDAATDAANDTRYENLLTRYFNDVGGSDIYGTATQYNGTNGFITNSSTFGGSVTDTNAYPHAGTVADPLTQQNLQDEVEAVRTAQSWPTGVNTEYFIYTGFGIQDCFPDGTTCSDSDFCAYHTWYDAGGGNHVIWANMPDARSLNGTNCDDFNVIGDNYADVEINVTSHEHLEAITDPEGTQSKYPHTSGLRRRLVRQRRPLRRGERRQVRIHVRDHKRLRRQHLYEQPSVSRPTRVEQRAR